MVEILSVVCIVLIVLVLCRWGIQTLLDILCRPWVIIPTGIFIVIWATKEFGIGTAVLFTLGLVSIYILRRNKR